MKDNKYSLIVLIKDAMNINHIKKRFNSVIIGIMIFYFISSFIYSAGEIENKEPLKFTLDSAIIYALTHSPVIEKNKWDKKKAQLLLEEVRARSVVPEFSLSGEAGVVPEARGDIFDSPDKQSDLDGWGPFFKLNVKLVQPIFTFGRRSAARTAAQKGIDLQSIKSDSEIEKLLLAVINSYLALSAAKEAESIADEVQENYIKLQKEVKKRLDSEDSDVDDTDLLEVKSNRYLIEEIVIKSKSERKLAEKAFNMAIGREITQNVEVFKEKIPTFLWEENEMAGIIQNALGNHRDIKGLKAALLGLQAKTKLAYSKKRPLIYLVGGFAYGHAAHRDDQTNPFAVDNFNYIDLGAFFGVQWDLNIFRKNIEAKKYQLEQESMAQNLKLLQSKIQLEILKAFGEVKKNIQLVEQAEASLKSAKSWLRLSMDNWDMGIGEVERLIKAYNSYYQLKGVKIKRTFELNTSLAHFAYMMGNTKNFLKWVKNEKVDGF